MFKINLKLLAGAMRKLAVSLSNWIVTWSRVFGLFTMFEPLGLFQLSCGPETMTFRRPQLSLEAFKVLRETCCGMGVISTGASFINYATVVFNDRSNLACDSIRLNNGHVVPGDIGNVQVVKALHQVRPDRVGLLTAGFPCQPYSVQGDGAGLMDYWGGTLAQVLRAAWLLQVDGLLLDNVVEVSQHADTMALLKQFAQAHAMHQSTCVLDLADQWPCKRRRWWHLMLSDSLPPAILADPCSASLHWACHTGLASLVLGTRSEPCME